MKITGAIFDMDGTLTESMQMWRSLRERYVRAKGLEPEKDLDKHLGEIGWENSYDYLRKTYGINLESNSEMYEDMKKLIVEPFYRNEVKLRSGTLELLEQLNSRGVKMCVASATDEWLVEIALETLNIRRYFSKLYCVPEFGKNKSFPDIFEAALEHLGTDKESTFVFEDALYSAKTAHEAGFPIVGIFDSTEPDQDGLKKIAALYVHDYRDDMSSLFEE